MEDLSLAQVVAVDELVVGEDVAMGVEDALGQPGGARSRWMRPAFA
jgi:hypothetical protein